MSYMRAACSALILRLCCVSGDGKQGGWARVCCAHFPTCMHNSTPTWAPSMRELAANESWRRRVAMILRSFPWRYLYI